MRRKTAILLFPNLELLDFAGPYEVFSVADQLQTGTLFDVYTVAAQPGPLRSINGLSVNPDYVLSEAPSPDLLIIPGGEGSKQVVQDAATLDWLRQVQPQAELTLSVCTGARILAHLGWLQGMPYCTHHSAYEELARLVPDGDPRPLGRFVGSGNLYTAAGVAAGIDLSLHVLQLLCGTEVAQATSRYMEYPPQAEKK